jgi:hypothetical protein
LAQAGALGLFAPESANDPDAHEENAERADPVQSAGHPGKTSGMVDIRSACSFSCRGFDKLVRTHGILLPMLDGATWASLE